MVYVCPVAVSLGFVISHTDHDYSLNFSHNKCFKIMKVADPVVANVKADTGLTYSDQTQNGSEKLAALKHLSS